MRSKNPSGIFAGTGIKGVIAAMLVPIGGTESKLTHKEIVEGLRALRKRVKPGKMSVREMVTEGRRF